MSDLIKVLRAHDFSIAEALHCEICKKVGPEFCEFIALDK